MNVSENVSESLPIAKTPQGCKPLQGLSLIVVGAAGLEPATSCSRSRRATGLRYAPLCKYHNNLPSLCNCVLLLLCRPDGPHNIASH